MKTLFRTFLLLHGLLFLTAFSSASAVTAQGIAKNLASVVEEARTAGVPEGTVTRLLALGYERQIASPIMANLLHVLVQAQRDQIPLEPFVSKIEEGTIKNVPAPVIEQVVVKRLEDYRFVRSQVFNYTKRHGSPMFIAPDYLVRLTETLYCGLSREDVDDVLHRAPSTSISNLTRGFEVLASLRQAGFDPDLSNRIVFAGLAQDYFTAEQRDFARALSLARKKGIPDAEIASAALAAIASKASTKDLCSRLGVTPQEIGRHGPQIGIGHFGAQGGHGRGSHGGSMGSGAGDHGGRGDRSGGHGEGGGSGGGDHGGGSSGGSGGSGGGSGGGGHR